MGDGDVLARLLDEHDVVELLYVYCETADAETPAAFVDCFTRDGLFTYRAHVATELAFSVRGHADLETWFVQRLPVVPPGTMNHTTVHPRVTIGGDRARATSRFISVRARPDGLLVASTGRYSDELVRCGDGRWRFAEGHSVGDMPR